MIWQLLIISLGLAAARDIQNVEPEYLDELRASGQDEKLAELLGIEKHLVRPDDSEQRSEGSRFNHVSFLGDIVLTEEQGRAHLNFDRYPSSRWPDGRIPYYIAGFTRRQRRTIENAVNAFNARATNLQLVKRSNERDYVYVFSGNGCWSYMGKTGGQQALSLQENGCLSTGTIQHEFLHAAGVTHEQNRIDRDDYVTVLWDNIPQSWHSQYEKTDSVSYNLIGPYDYYSVMHYPIWAPETYEDAFKIPDGIDRDRLGRDLTDLDVYKIDTLYS